MKTRITIHLNYHLRTWIDPNTGQADQNGLQAEAFSGHRQSISRIPGIYAVEKTNSRERGTDRVLIGYEITTEEYAVMFVPIHNIAAVVTADCHCNKCYPEGLDA